MLFGNERVASVQRGRLSRIFLPLVARKTYIRNGVLCCPSVLCTGVAVPGFEATFFRDLALSVLAWLALPLPDVSCVFSSNWFSMS